MINVSITKFIVFYSLFVIHTEKKSSDNLTTLLIFSKLKQIFFLERFRKFRIGIFMNFAEFCCCTDILIFVEPQNVFFSAEMDNKIWSYIHFLNVLPKKNPFENKKFKLFVIYLGIECDITYVLVRATTYRMCDKLLIDFDNPNHLNTNSMMNIQRIQFVSLFLYRNLRTLTNQFNLEACSICFVARKRCV